MARDCSLCRWPLLVAIVWGKREHGAATGGIGRGMLLGAWDGGRGGLSAHLGCWGPQGGDKEWGREMLQSGALSPPPRPEALRHGPGGA